MVIEVMRYIGIFYYWTWFIWPFVFVFSLAKGIARKVNKEESADQYILAAAISFLIILAGITTPNFK
jgi:hypothetical protein